MRCFEASAVCPLKSSFFVRWNLLVCQILILSFWGLIMSGRTNITNWKSIGYSPRRCPRTCLNSKEVIWTTVDCVTAGLWPWVMTVWLRDRFWSGFHLNSNWEVVREAFTIECPTLLPLIWFDPRILWWTIWLRTQRQDNAEVWLAQRRFL